MYACVWLIFVLFFYSLASFQEVRIKGTFYITDHYFAFLGKKAVDLSHLEINRQFRDVMRHDEVITIKRHTKSTKALVFTDLGQVRG